jgi:hypothetical protein
LSILNKSPPQSEEEASSPGLTSHSA